MWIGGSNRARQIDKQKTQKKLSLDFIIKRNNTKPKKGNKYTC